LASASPASQFNGVAYIVVYQVYASDGSAQVSSFKRIIVSDKSAVAGATRNSNPSLLDILANGSSLAAFPAAPASLSASLGAGSAETYSWKGTDGSVSSKAETIETTWFITDGDVQYFRTDGAGTTVYTPPAANPSPARNALVIAVSRDGRGGEAAIKRRMP
jgi:hypothetical protein